MWQNAGVETAVFARPQQREPIRGAIMVSFRKLPGAKDARKRRGIDDATQRRGDKTRNGVPPAVRPHRETTVPIERTKSRFGRDGAAGQLW